MSYFNQNQREGYKPSLTLKKGDTFIQSWAGVVRPLKFKVLDIDHPSNKITVKCIDHRGYSHEETWDDLNVTEMAFETGEYRLITSEENAEQRLASMKEFAKEAYVRDHVKIVETEFRFDPFTVSQCLIPRDEFEKQAKLDVARKLIVTLIEEGKINFIISGESIKGAIVLVDPETFDNQI